MKSSNQYLRWVSVVILAVAGVSFAAPAKTTVPAKTAVRGMPANAPPAKPAEKVLVVLSDATAITLLNKKAVPAGYFYNELMIPAMALMTQGYAIVFATPKGKKPAVFPPSDQAQYFESPAQYQAAKHAQKTLFAINNPLSFKMVMKLGLDQYKAILVPGGHAPMVDLENNAVFGQILLHFHSHQKPTALICHGTVGLLSAAAGVGNQKTPWPYQGYKMTAFSTAEEKEAEASMGGKVPYYVDAALTHAGGVLSVGAKWKSNVVHDRELITGQNPNSAKQLAETLVAALKGK